MLYVFTSFTFEQIYPLFILVCHFSLPSINDLSKHFLKTNNNNRETGKLIYQNRALLPVCILCYYSNIPWLECRLKIKKITSYFYSRFILMGIFCINMRHINDYICIHGFDNKQRVYLYTCL